MKVSRRSNYVLLAGASALAITAATPVAVAQDQDEDNTRTLSTVLVTTQKTEESIQDVPIAVSAFDEGALDDMQLAGGPDLVKAIPNVNFTKGNFGGFNFRIRGIGVDAVSTAADAGVGVHLNDVPLTSNSLFEAEFYDVERVETLRGPQGTLYGRNATGGVVNLITAKPVLEEFQADARLTYGNYNTVKGKGMVNLPIGETAALRMAGSYLSRDGYVDNLTTGNDIDDRELYSLRASLAFEPTDRLRGLVMVEHFNEDDSRLRSGKQFCATDPTKTSFGGAPISFIDQIITSQGCVDAPVRSNASLGGINQASTLGGGVFGALAGVTGAVDANGNLFNINEPGAYNPDYRTIESSFDPTFETEQTFYMLRAEYDVTDNLTATYLGSFNERMNISQEDYNETAPAFTFNTTPGPFIALNGDSAPVIAAAFPALFPGGVVSDPQLGQANFLEQADISGSESEQTSHEIRLQSDFDGPFNFNVGAIKLDFEVNQGPAVQESYYVFFNTGSAFVQANNAVGQALLGGDIFSIAAPANAGATALDNLGNGTDRNYFRSITPYKLDSFAVFGEGYFDVTDDLQLTLGLRYTDDKKEVGNIPTFLATADAGRPDPLVFVPNPGATANNGGDGTLNAQFEEVTGRFGFDWAPDFAWSEDTLIYAFYSRGYKGGGINPPQPADNTSGVPQTFDPEFIDSYEVGTKNTLAGGAMQLNATGFFYNYEGYQISAIVNRTSANFNVDAEIKGLELETIWNPASTFVVNANLGLLDAQVVDTFGVAVLDRTNGRSDLVVLKNFANASNCVVSAQGYATLLGAIAGGLANPGDTLGLCSGALQGLEAAFGLGGVTVSYTDGNGNAQTATAFEPFDGDAKDLDGNALPGTPDTTFNFGAEYTWEGVFNDAWDVRLRGDYYYQASAFSRIWNTQRDVLESWDNINLSLQLMNTENDWSVEIFGKNITDEEVITGAYLTDDSSGLFTNVFLNEPSTYGVTISKRW
ncbi:MAG: TonB-dependent receptor [Henriciella sp.]|nr:TonB-dependent receptor [Henriciella sp.]